MKTFGQRLSECNGVGPGFDNLRVGLSLTVFFYHCFVISYGREFNPTFLSTPLATPVIAILPLFFALSGFLIMGSAVRAPTLRTFITLRFLRIFPALITEVTLSAVVLGSIATTLPLHDYLSQPKFLSYFGSIFGKTQYVLPGVFGDVPYYVTVNAALWTIQPELFCYALSSLLFMYRLFKKKYVMLIVIILMFVFNIIVDSQSQEFTVGQIAPARILILCYLIGTGMFLWKDRIPYDYRLFIASIIVALTNMVLGIIYPKMTVLFYPALVCLAYALVYVGLSPARKLPWFSRGDYSYGIYLYGWPIQQAVAHFFPAWREWYVSLAIGLPVTLALAALSWHFIELPFLSLKKRLVPKGSYTLKPLLQENQLVLYSLTFALILYGFLLFHWSRDIFPDALGLRREVIVMVTIGAISALFLQASRLMAERKTTLYAYKAKMLSSLNIT